MPLPGARSSSTDRAEDRLLDVSVACIAGDGVHLVELRVREGATIGDVIRASGILERCPEIDLGTASVGIYNHERPVTFRVRQGDRVEIYRPLEVDPKEARRRRAAKARAR